MTTGVSVEGREGIAQLTMHGRSDLNLLGLEVFRALNNRLEQVAKDDHARVLVLRGAGDRAFSAGVDLREMKVLAPLEAEAFIRALHSVNSKLLNLPLPAIAAIQGPCLGGALELALACDMRIVTDDAIFGLPEVRVGVPSVIEASLLPRTVGLGRARAMLLTGGTLDAEKALHIGLVDRVVAKEGLEAAVLEAAQEFLGMSRYILSVQKDIIAKWLEMGDEEAAEYSIKAFALCFATPIPAEAMNAFLDKREARF